MRKLIAPLAILLVLVAPLLAPLASSMVVEKDLYLPFTSVKASIYEDYVDMLNSPMMTRAFGGGGSVQEDVANYVFQGPGIFGSPSVGYMIDMNVTLTKLGTLVDLVYANYSWVEATAFPGMPWYGHTTPMQGENVKETLEGWFLTFKVPEYAGDFRGVLVVTFSGIDTVNRAIVPYVIYNWTTGKKFEITGVDVYTLAGNDKANARLVVKKYVIHIYAESLGDEDDVIKLYFNYTIIATINKATKRVVFNQYVDYKMETKCCDVVPLNIRYGRIAVISAGLVCKSFYGWNIVKLPKCSCNESTLPIFLLLSWTNSSLDPDWREIDDDYAVYMAAYPASDKFNFAISSTFDDPAFSSIWRAIELQANYVNINMSDHDGDNIPDGDLALVRVEWKHDVILHPGDTGETPLVTIAYGIYDVNGTAFDGGEGGPFDYGSLVLSNGTQVAAPGIVVHSPASELGFLETGNATAIQNAEAKLTKVVQHVDLDNNGIIAQPPSNETNVNVSWWPVEELVWQLYNIFQGPCFNKLADFGKADFLAIHPAQIATDPAGAAWLQGVLQAYMVTYDVDVAGIEVWVGAASSAVHVTVNPHRRMPFLLLRLTGPIDMGKVKPLTLKDMRSYFEAADGRYLLQMEPVDVNSTAWRDVHYLVVAVAGPGANRITRYFNDFAGIFFGFNITKEVYDAVGALAGVEKLGSRIVIGPTGEIIVPSPNENVGYAVVAIVKDHFNNTGFIVWGLSAAETYWASYWVAHHLSDLTSGTYCCAKALLLKINYTTPNGTDGEWGVIDGGYYKSTPIGAPNVPEITVYKCVSGQEVVCECGE